MCAIELHGSSIFHNNEGVFINTHTGAHPFIHKHDFFEIAYIAKGRGLHILGDKQIEVVEGDYFIINTGVSHGYKELEELTIYNCIFLANFLDASMLGIDDFHNILDHYLFKHLVISDISQITNCKFHANDTIHNLFIEMYQEYTQKNNGYIQILTTDILKLLILTLRNNNTYNLLLPNQQNVSYDQVIRYITENYEKPLTIKSLANRIYVSPEHFCRTFKKYTGISVWDFIKKVRIDKAQTLLLNTNLSICKVAEAVGYYDEKHFSKLFKEKLGISPSKYRKFNGSPPRVEQIQ